MKKSSGATAELLQVPFNEVNEPGAYVAEDGRLFRFQADGLKQGHSPLVTVTSNTPMNLTKISDDPNVAVGKARQIAADADIQPNF